MRWFIGSIGETKGPYSAADIRREIDCGRLRRGMHIREESENWTLVEQSRFAHYFAPEPVAVEPHRPGLFSSLVVGLGAAALLVYCTTRVIDPKENDSPSAKTYSPSQLKQMINSGKYPPQETATTRTSQADFASCVANMTQVVAAVGNDYPNEIIVDTAVLKTHKVWANDAAITVSCSAPDQKMLITSAKYL